MPVVRSRARVAYVALTLTFAALLGLPHLSMPPGREGAALEVAARALRSGHPVELPTSTTPGALALALGGTFLSSMPGLGARVLSLIFVLALGVVAPRAFSRRAVPLEATAASVLAASWFSHAFFDFSSSGRGEIPAHLALLSAVALAGSAPQARQGEGARHWILAHLGPVVLFTAAATISPRTALLLPLLAHVVSARQGRRRGAAVAGAAVVALVATFGALRGRLGTAGVASAFATERSAPLAGGLATLLTHFRPTAGVLSCVALLALVRWFDRPAGDDQASHDRAALLAYALGTSALCSVSWSGGVSGLEAMIGPFATMAGAAADRAASPGPRWRWLPLGTVLLALLGLVASTSNPATKSKGNRATGQYVKRVRDGALALLGGGSKAAYLATFSVESADFFADESSEVGEWLRANGEAGDALLVRGYEPQIYLHAGMSPGAPGDLSRPPRWIVAPRAQEGLEPRGHATDGYHLRTIFPHFLIFDRARPTQ